MNPNDVRNGLFHAVTAPSEAHKASFRNRNRLVHGAECGCYWCLKIFPADEITEWWDEGQTAVCPYCGIDSVVGESGGKPLTEEDLRLMHEHQFGDAKA